MRVRAFVVCRVRQGEQPAGGRVETISRPASLPISPRPPLSHFPPHHQRPLSPSLLSHPYVLKQHALRVAVRAHEGHQQLQRVERLAVGAGGNRRGGEQVDLRRWSGWW